MGRASSILPGTSRRVHHRRADYSRCNFRGVTYGVAEVDATYTQHTKVNPLTDKVINRNITPLVAPRSIAVIGASANPTKSGGVLFDNLLKGKFQGPLCPINRTAK